MDDPDGFRDFVHSSSPQLLRTAWLLTGDWHRAEDLVQAALVKALPRWDRLTRRDKPDLYVRKIILNSYLSWRRRRASTEIILDLIPDLPAPDNRDVDLHADVIAAVRTLPPRQRAVIALRYFDDLAETDTATVLGCSVGTVKSHTARALTALRANPTLTAMQLGDPTL